MLALRALRASASVRSMSTTFPSWTSTLNKHLDAVDPEMAQIIENEKKRQLESVVLIPSENFTSQAVLDALGSVMQNKYSEGYPGARYYGGNEFIDQSESLCQKRALDAFNLDPAKWGVNVQPLSGSPANLYVYGALLKPHDRIMGLDLPHGGHLSHGYQTPTKKISYVSVYYETIPYRLNTQTGTIDYDKLAEIATLVRPKLIVAGASAYSRDYDYPKFRQVADSVGAYLHSDIAHIAGMLSAGLLKNPFEYSDVVTTTTHKSLRGPRGAMIFYRKGVKGQDKAGNPINYHLEDAINASVFPGHQGGPHNHTIAALAVALKQAKSPEFVAYQTQVLQNSKSFAKNFLDKGYQIVSGGTDNHLLLLDLKPSGIDGARVERVLELVNIAANKNTTPQDTSALVPSGLRMGTPAMTTRGFVEKDFAHVANFVDQAITITKDINSKVAGKKLKDFKDVLADGGKAYPAIDKLKKEVSAFASSFPGIGF